MRVRYGNTLMTLKAVPSIQAISFTNEYDTASDATGAEIMRFLRRRDLGIDVKFAAVVDGGKLCEITVPKK